MGSERAAALINRACSHTRSRSQTPAVSTHTEGRRLSHITGIHLDLSMRRVYQMGPRSPAEGPHWSCCGAVTLYSAPVLSSLSYPRRILNVKQQITTCLSRVRKKKKNLYHLETCMKTDGPTGNHLFLMIMIIIIVGKKLGL